MGYSEVKVKEMITEYLGTPNFPFWDNFLGYKNLASMFLVFLGLRSEFLVHSKESEDWCGALGVCQLQRSRLPHLRKRETIHMV